MLLPSSGTLQQSLNFSETEQRSQLTAYRSTNLFDGVDDKDFQIVREQQPFLLEYEKKNMTDTLGFDFVMKTFLHEFDRKLKKRSESLVGDCKGEGNIVILKFKSSTQINQIEIQEDISKGEHIRSYYVEGLADGNWIRLCEGTSVGHKRIQLFDQVNVRSLRLTVENSGGLPSIRRFAAYNYQSANPE